LGVVGDALLWFVSSPSLLPPLSFACGESWEEEEH